MTKIWLGLGSNIGDRASQIGNAIRYLEEFVDQIVQSPLYETEPQDYLKQRNFLNNVIRGQTELNPCQLLKHIGEVEKKCGRQRKKHFPAKGPRTVDIDILLWGNQVIRSQEMHECDLIVPHPAMTRRLFVLKPLQDIDPDIMDPTDGILYSHKALKLLDQYVEVYHTG